jgi:hypothetical protein
MRVKSRLTPVLLLILSACTHAAIPSARPSASVSPGPSASSRTDTPVSTLLSKVRESRIGLPATATGRAPRGKVPTLLAGPAHCEAQNTIWLVLPYASLRNQYPVGYVRDPARSGSRGFQAAAALPQDARFTGWKWTDTELWLARSDAKTFGYLVTRAAVERWTALPGLCA